ncbi:Sorting nexin mvp1, partial [Coemansia sp. RSA 2607]
MSDLYDILDPWGPSNGGGADGGAATTVSHGPSGFSDSSRGCLDKVILPPVYTIAYSATKKAGGGQITREVLQRALMYSGLPRHIVGQIVLTADTGAPTISQQDFNLALAMTAMAQKNMPPTIDAVVFHKDDLPVPELDGIESLSSQDPESGAFPDVPARRADGGSGAFPESSDDPWSTSIAKNTSAPMTAAMGAISITDVGSGPETASSVPLPDGSSVPASKETQSAAVRSSIGGPTSVETFVPQISMDGVQWKLDIEDVSVKEAAEKGGIVFKHTNYEVNTRSFSSMVVRRYNDFFWISNYLVKRYPYRMHPNIPPKGFPVDRHFLDNRIKGLTRFASAILRIPFLRRDALIIQFFSNTDEFSRVVKIGNLDMDAEVFDPEEEIGNTPWGEVQQTYAAFDDFYAQVARDEEKYRIQITALEKIARYKQAIGDELYAYSDTIRT